MTKTKASDVGQISRYQVNITVRMAASVILKRLMYAPWGTAEMPVDFTSQFLIEFAVKKTTNHS